MTEQVAAPTRERLLRAAQELIESGGYGAASVMAIAERAGVAAGTLYRHFDSKEDLFVELFRSVCDREVRAMQAAAEQMPEGSSQVQRLVTVLSTFAQRALRRPRLAWALIAEPVDPLVDAERLAYRARYSELAADALKAGIAAGEIMAFYLVHHSIDLWGINPGFFALLVNVALCALVTLALKRERPAFAGL